MFDLDRLSAFDRGLATLVPAAASRDDEARRTRTAPEIVPMRCTMTASLGVEPLCPFARAGVPA